MFEFDILVPILLVTTVLGFLFIIFLMFLWARWTMDFNQPKKMLEFPYIEYQWNPNKVAFNWIVVILAILIFSGFVPGLLK